MTERKIIVYPMNEWVDLEKYSLGSADEYLVKLQDPQRWYAPSLRVVELLQQWIQATGGQKMIVGRALNDRIVGQLEMEKKKFGSGIIDFRQMQKECAASLKERSLPILILISQTQYAVEWSVREWGQAIKENPQIYSYLHKYVQSIPECIHAAVTSDCMNYLDVPSSARAQVTVAHWALSAKGCGFSEFEALYPKLPNAIKNDMKVLVQWHKKGWISKNRSERFLGDQRERLKFIQTQKKMQSVWDVLKWMGAKMEGNEVSINMKKLECGTQEKESEREVGLSEIKENHFEKKSLKQEGINEMNSCGMKTRKPIRL